MIDRRPIEAEEQADGDGGREEATAERTIAIEIDRLDGGSDLHASEETRAIRRPEAGHEQRKPLLHTTEPDICNIEG